MPILSEHRERGAGKEKRCCFQQCRRCVCEQRAGEGGVGRGKERQHRCEDRGSHALLSRARGLFEILVSVGHRGM